MLLAKLLNRVDLLDNVIGCYNPELGRRESNAIKVQDWGTGWNTKVRDAMIMLHLTGAAGVWDGDRLIVIASARTFDVVTEAAIRSALKQPYLAAFDDWLFEGLHTIENGILRARRARISVDRIAHVVVQNFGCFRYYQAGGPREGDPEVVLFNQAGGLYLGGAVWRRQFYQYHHDVPGFVRFCRKRGVDLRAAIGHNMHRRLVKEASS